MVTDYHGSTPLRALAPLADLDAFHKAFGTKPGDPMWLAPEAARGDLVIE